MATNASSPANAVSAGSSQPAIGLDAETPTFITTWSCPYAQRTWIVLNEKGVKYDPVYVDLKNKPEWFFQHNPYGRVPTLVWQDNSSTTSMYESLICNEYLEDLIPEPALLPTSAIGKAKVRLLIDQFGVKVGGAFGKVMFGADSAAAGKDLDEGLRWLESQISAAGGPFVAGSSFTLADAAMAPFMIRLPVLGELCGYKLPEDVPLVSAYITKITSHPSVAASINPPDSSRSYHEQMLETYKDYTAARKAAAAASN